MSDAEKVVRLVGHCSDHLMAAVENDPYTATAELVLAEGYTADMERISADQLADVLAHQGDAERGRVPAGAGP